MITVVDYDSTWPDTFGMLRDRYLYALRDVAIVTIEHVGSTSVEGLAAKPVIDIDIVVAAEQVGAASSALVGIGYQPLGEMGIAQRWAFREPPHSPRTNTYVVVDGSLALRNHLAARNLLRTNPELRDEYARLKRRLAVTVVESDAYVEAKSALLSRVLRQAGFDDSELATVEAANRREPQTECLNRTFLRD